MPLRWKYFHIVWNTIWLIKAIFLYCRSWSLKLMRLIFFFISQLIFTIMLVIRLDSQCFITWLRTKIWDKIMRMASYVNHLGTILTSIWDERLMQFHRPLNQQALYYWTILSDSTVNDMKSITKLFLTSSSFSFWNNNYLSRKNWLIFCHYQKY